MDINKIRNLTFENENVKKISDDIEAQIIEAAQEGYSCTKVELSSELKEQLYKISSSGTQVVQWYDSAIAQKKLEGFTVLEKYSLKTYLAWK